jgi:hypothetical protein
MKGVLVTAQCDAVAGTLFYLFNIYSKRMGVVKSNCQVRPGISQSKQ